MDIEVEQSKVAPAAEEEGPQRIIDFELSELGLNTSLENEYGVPQRLSRFYTFINSNSDNRFNNLTIDQWLENIQSFGMNQIESSYGNISYPTVLFDNAAMARDQWSRAQSITSNIYEIYKSGKQPSLILMDGPGRFTYFLLETLEGLLGEELCLDFYKNHVYYCNLSEENVRFQRNFFPQIDTENIGQWNIIDFYKGNQGNRDQIYYFNFMGLENHIERKAAASYFVGVSSSEFSTCSLLLRLYSNGNKKNTLQYYTFSTRRANATCVQFIELLRRLPGYEVISTRGSMITIKIGFALEPEEEDEKPKGMDLDSKRKYFKYKFKYLKLKKIKN
ncbi:hypothetical protein CPAV1605_1413 [seawater metagenome]|uniref:Uncharacterized protein n=1 Tax=seawater metagenome TaxID=1561972 RepID=A0A5E8CMJ6_9ZZZZ